MNKVIELTESTLKLKSDQPRNEGTKVDVDITFPEGATIKSLLVSGIVIKCDLVNYRHDNSDNYLLEVQIDRLTAVAEKILKAYIDFLQRDKMLKEIRTDQHSPQEVFYNLDGKLNQLLKTSKEAEMNLRGALEQLRIKNSNKKIIFH